MSRRLVALGLAVLVAMALVATIWSVARTEGRSSARPSLALFTSLPIYWAEAPDLFATVRGEAPAHWARTALERSWRLIPLDMLERSSGLDGQARLAMIQPRPLSPSENVALDAWIERGGRLLLFADPALTAPSAFALGDRRRPQATVLLSPILTRWGLELRFDERQPATARWVPLARETVLPVRLAGSFALRFHHPASRCRVAAGAVIARCRVGKGSVVAVADAALFEPPADAADAEARAQALDLLTGMAFAG